MKKTLLLLATGLLLASGSFAQNITINEYGETINVSGQIIDVTANEADTTYILFNNLSQSNQPWIITRRILTQPVGWENYLCWGLNGGIGICYPVSLVEYSNSNSETIPASNSGKLSAYVTPNQAGVAWYRYYISTDGATYLDSVDLRVTSTLSIAEVAPSLNVSIAPNPSSEFITVTAEGVNKATVRIIDVLGNLILTNEITESKMFDVSEYRNGIYFIIVESNGAKTVNRKVIIHH